MKKIKVLALVLALVMSLSLMTACGGSDYKNDVSLETLATNLDGVVSSENNMTAVPASYMDTYFNMDSSNYEAYIIKINNSGTNVDEYGIFKATDEDQANSLEEGVKAYFAFREDIVMPEYNPEELPKLTGAEVKIFGNYVVYGILDEASKEAVFAKIEELLKA